MNFSDKPDTDVETALNGADAVVVLAREAGMPFQPQLGDASGIDPISEWLSLMEVVQVEASLSNLSDPNERKQLLDILDLQAIAFLEQCSIQGERTATKGDASTYAGDAQFAAAWLQINSNFRRGYKVPSKNLRSLALRLDVNETLSDRLSQSR
jgi:hypothetical protein